MHGEEHFVSPGQWTVGTQTPRIQTPRIQTPEHQISITDLAKIHSWVLVYTNEPSPDDDNVCPYITTRGIPRPLLAAEIKPGTEVLPIAPAEAYHYFNKLGYLDDPTKLGFTEFRLLLGQYPTLMDRPAWQERARPKNHYPQPDYFLSKRKITFTLETDQAVTVQDTQDGIEVTIEAAYPPQNENDIVLGEEHIFYIADQIRWIKEGRTSAAE